VVVRHCAFVVPRQAQSARHRARAHGHPPARPTCRYAQSMPSVPTGRPVIAVADAPVLRPVPARADAVVPAAIARPATPPACGTLAGAPWPGLLPVHGFRRGWIVAASPTWTIRHRAHPAARLPYRIP